MWQVTISERLEAIDASISRLEDKYEQDDDALNLLMDKIGGLIDERDELKKKQKELLGTGRIAEISRELICARKTLGVESSLYSARVDSIKCKIIKLQQEKDSLTYRNLYLK